MKSIRLSFFILICLITSAQAQKKMIGDTVVFAKSKKEYAIKAHYQSIEWELYPQTFGTVVEGQSTDKIIVQWNAYALGFKHNSRCTLIAKIKYPNADMAVNFGREIVIKNSVDSTKYKRKNINSKFSNTSKDSLRYFYQVICDSSLIKRRITFTDSSLKKSNVQSSSWILKQSGSDNEIKGNGKKFGLTLSPGHYTVMLQQQHNDKVFMLADTLTIYGVSKPSFTISNQLPCAESLITFSNTSAHQELTLNSTFNFGNGDNNEIAWPEKTTTYSYDGNGMALILMTYLEIKDLYGCNYKTAEIPIAVQENKFTRTNVSIEPRTGTLKQSGDSILILPVLSNGFSPANPNAPFTYLWNTGQTNSLIYVTEAGEYNFRVTDKLGCKSEISPSARIVKVFKENNVPKINGPTTVKAGTKMQFKIAECTNCLYQWKFIFNDGLAMTTEPSNQSKITPEGCQKLPQGILKVIGIQLNRSSGKSIFSDTLKVVIGDGNRINH